MSNCKHPPSRYFCGYAYNPFTGRTTDRENLWIVCLDCHEMLKEAAFEKRIREMEQSCKPSAT